MGRSGCAEESPPARSRGRWAPDLDATLRCPANPFQGHSNLRGSWIALSLRDPLGPAKRQLEQHCLSGIVEVEPKRLVVLIEVMEPDFAQAIGTERLGVASS